SRWAYDGTPLPVTDTEITSPAITTRDIDRGRHPHFLLKEISEAPASFRTTLRGKLLADDTGRLGVALSDTSFPPSIRADLAAGRIDRVTVIGQGTAAVAGQSLAAVLSDLVAHTSLRVE